MCKQLTANALNSDIRSSLVILQRCLDLQSKEDGIDRANLGDLNWNNDPFVEQVNHTAKHIDSLRDLIPVFNQLNKLGEELEKRKLIKIDLGQSYANAALEYFSSLIGSK
jgi:hypothetical protein